MELDEEYGGVMKEPAVHIILNDTQSNHDPGASITGGSYSMSNNNNNNASGGMNELTRIPPV